MASLSFTPHRGSHRTAMTLLHSPCHARIQAERAPHVWTALVSEQKEKEQWS